MPPQRGHTGTKNLEGPGNALADVTALRHRLHETPEVAFREERTADEVKRFLQHHAGLAPVDERVAGTGLLYRIDGDGDGPTRLLRAELDGLPLTERSAAPHPSRHEGHHHACGHDGHMAMLAGALVALAADPTWPGTVYALFQPAEETGEGAAAALDAPAVQAIPADLSFAFHNLPGEPLGAALLRPGPMAAASVGLHIRLEGATSHAAAPHQGRNPIPALATLALRAESFAHTEAPYDTGALVTPIHLDAGAIAYGTAAGAGSVRFTVRADDDGHLANIVARIRREAEALAQAGGFSLTVEEHDRFPATTNDPGAVRVVERAARRAGLDLRIAARPRPWSEDFGHLTSRWPGALIGLGSGTEQAQLHTPEYDFPDALLAPGIRLWTALVHEGMP